MDYLYLAEDLPFTAACLLSRDQQVFCPTQNKRIEEHLRFQFGSFGFDKFNQVNMPAKITLTSWRNTLNRTPKHIVCFGAGIDSTVLLYKMAQMFKQSDILAFYLDYGGPWSAKEKVRAAAVRKAVAYDLPGIQWMAGEVRTSNDKPLGLIKGYILPGRNAMFMELAAELWPDAEDILLAANYKKDDTVGAVDKGRLFFGDMTDILGIRCWSPVLHRTKLQALLDLDNPGTVQKILTMTTSCYDETSSACGTCYACFKRNLLCTTLKHDYEIGRQFNWENVPHIDIATDTLPDVYFEYAEREVAKGRKFSNAIMDRIFGTVE